MQPLEGIRVIDLAPLGPGPHCAQILADLGAEIVRIDRPDEAEGPRAGRIIRLPEQAAIRRDARSLRLNLKSSAGHAVFLKLAATADVIIEGFRPGAVKRLGVDYNATCRVKPDIIYASLTGYGQDGPYAQCAGHDINYQAIAGILSMTGRAGDVPVIPGNAIADNAGGGLNAVIGILVALFVRERTGQGQYIDMAMIDGLIAMMFLTIDDYLTTGTIPSRGETLLTGRYPCYNVYETKDRKYVSVGAIEPWFYENLCRLLGREDFISHQYAEGEKRDEIFDAFRQIFRTKTRDQWVAELMPADTCVAPVLSIDEVVRDRQLRQRKLILEGEAPDGSRHTTVGAMVRLSGTPARVRRPSPSDGEDHAVLRELGYDSAAIERLRQNAAIS